MPAADHRLARNIKPLLDFTQEAMIAFDQNWKVLGQSKSHRAMISTIWGGDGDLRGVDWVRSKYMPDMIREGLLRDIGVGPTALNRGMLSTRVPFYQEVGGKIVNAGRTDGT